MKHLAFVLLLTLGCTAPPKPVPEAPTPGRVGSTIGGPIFRAPLNPVTGNNATIIVLDTTNVPIFPKPERLVVSCRFDQQVTILYQVQRLGSVTWRTVNGNGTGDVVSANTDTFIDYLVLGPNNRIEVVTGSTGPTVAEINIGPVYDRPLAF
jgi:hypothetical protein